MFGCSLNSLVRFVHWLRCVWFCLNFCLLNVLIVRKKLIHVYAKKTSFV